jgi:hypothetical protein
MMEQLIKFKTAQKRLQSTPAPLVVDEFTPTLNQVSSLFSSVGDGEVDCEELEIVDKEPFIVEATLLKPDEKGRKRSQRLQLVRTLYYGIENLKKSREVK